MLQIKRKKIVLLCILFIVIGAGLGSLGTWAISTDCGAVKQVPIDQYNEYKQLSDRFSKLNTIYNYVDSNYYIDFDEEDAMTGIYKGLFSGIGDEYSTYFTKDEYESWNASVNGEFEGIGIVFTRNDDSNLEIISVIKDTPAEKAGLKVGDVIYKIDGKQYEDLELASSAMRGKKGTKVEITYIRDEESHTVTIKRDTIHEESVYTKKLNDKVGYIQITSFDEDTAEDFSKALEEVENSGATSFVLDLRNNGGGIVEEGNEIADILLDEGTVVYLKDRKGKKSYLTSKDGKTELTYVVLVNGGTASTSEILTAAIKDNEGGKIVGTTTFGKGIVQSTSKLKDGSAVKLTIMQYFSPDGDAINGKGIEPDYVVKQGDSDEDKQLSKALELLSK